MTQQEQQNRTGEQVQDSSNDANGGAGPMQPADQAGADQAGTADSQAELAAQLAEANSRLLKAQAETENVRKRMGREMDESRRYAAVGLLQDLLGVADNLQRAIAAAETAENTSGLLDGVKMVAVQLEQILARHHCERIDAVGRPFDPHLHEALGQQSSAEHEPGTVVMELRGGYKLHDRVVRPAQVFIAAPPEQGSK